MKSHPVIASRSDLGLCLGLCLSALWLGGCPKEAQVGSDVAVSIDGELLEYTEFERYLRDNVGTELDLDPETLSQLLDQFLDEQLLVRLAIERGLVGGTVDQRKALAFLLRGGKRNWSPAEIEGYYHAHRDDFSLPERVHLRQILCNERPKAEEARKALRQGEDFVKVAARLSDGPRAHIGGDQGVLGRDDLPPSFVDLIFSLPTGATTDIIEAEYGFLIFQVVERLPPQTVPLDEASDDIERRLDEQRVDDQIGSLVQEARERYNAEVFPSNIPFDYQGIYATSD